MAKSNNVLYDYVFHFNENTELWAAIPRDKQKEYFNNMSERINTGILYSRDFTALLDILSHKNYGKTVGNSIKS